MFYVWKEKDKFIDRNLNGFIVHSVHQVICSYVIDNLNQNVDGI